MAAEKSKLKERKGALTVEAALVMPVLLCAFFTVLFLIKTVCTYELIQHALDETASEIASAGYIYHISGIRDIHDTVRDKVNYRSELFKNQISSVFETYDTLSAIGAGSRQGSEQNPGQGSGSAADGTDALDKAGDNFRKLLEQADAAAEDPLDELKSIACYIAAGYVNDAKTQLFTPVVKLYMKKYLVTGSIANADQRLKILNIENGFEGLDFSGSSFLSDSEEYIDIVVRYKVNLILPQSFMPDLEIVQRSRAKAWLGGDVGNGVLDGFAGNDTEDIWSLSNFQRGLKIRRLFGANLPDSFPVISAFESGKAVMIKSMDLTAAGYQTGSNAEKTLKGYINELAGYKGQEKPWGGEGIVIKKESIESREVLLVIPQNKLSAANEAMLTEMIGFARSKGVDLNIERYGMKKDKSDGNGNDTHKVGDSGAGGDKTGI